MQQFQFQQALLLQQDVLLAQCWGLLHSQSQKELLLH
jgi:hypothetical protein